MVRSAPSCPGKMQRFRLARLPGLSVLCFLLLLVAPAYLESAWPQTSGHQRLGVEAKTYWEADIEWAVSLSPAGYSDYRLPNLESSLTFGLLLGRTWSAGFSVPFSLYSHSAYNAPIQCIPGDISASFGWTAALGDSRVRGNFNLTGPSAHWFDNQEVPGASAGGSGRWILGISAGLSRIIDPLVLGGQVAWSVGLPRAERWESLWRPCDFSVVMSATEAFNEHISATVVLSQYASIPAVAWGTSIGRILSGTVAYDAAAGVKLGAAGRAFSGSIGFSKGLVHGADPGSIDFSVAYFIRRREEP